MHSGNDVLSYATKILLWNFRLSFKRPMLQFIIIEVWSFFNSKLLKRRINKKTKVWTTMTFHNVQNVYKLLLHMFLSSFIINYIGMIFYLFQ